MIKAVFVYTTFTVNMYLCMMYNVLSCNQYICCINVIYEYIFALFVLDE
jgi:hypothetical protein